MNTMYGLYRKMKHVNTLGSYSDELLIGIYDNIVYILEDILEPEDGPVVYSNRNMFDLECSECFEGFVIKLIPVNNRYGAFGSNIYTFTCIEEVKEACRKMLDDTYYDE